MTLNLQERQFDIGSVVRLKSGSGKMVVTGFVMEGYCCEWIGFNNHQPFKAIYPGSCLEIEP